MNSQGSTVERNIQAQRMHMQKISQQIKFSGEIY